MARKKKAVMGRPRTLSDEVKLVTFYLEPADHAAAKDVAQGNLSALLRRLLDAELRRHGKKLVGKY